MPELASRPAEGSAAEGRPLRGAGIAGVGMSVPENVVENAVINERLGLKDKLWGTTTDSASATLFSTVALRSLMFDSSSSMREINSRR